MGCPGSWPHGGLLGKSGDQRPGPWQGVESFQSSFFVEKSIDSIKLECPYHTTHLFSWNVYKFQKNSFREAVFNLISLDGQKKLRQERVQLSQEKLEQARKEDLQEFRTYLSYPHARLYHGDLPPASLLDLAILCGQSTCARKLVSAGVKLSSDAMVTGLVQQACKIGHVEGNLNLSCGSFDLAVGTVTACRTAAYEVPSLHEMLSKTR